MNTSRKNQVHWCTNLLGLVVDIRGEAERLMKPVGFSPSVCCEAASVFFDFDCGAAVCFFLRTQLHYQLQPFFGKRTKILFYQALFFSIFGRNQSITLYLVPHRRFEFSPPVFNLRIRSSPLSAFRRRSLRLRARGDR